MQVVEDDEDYEVKQMKDLAAAKMRWQSLVREGKVKVLTPREAGYAIKLSNKTLLDVRPSTEREKAWVKGSTWIPIFDVDEQLEAGTIVRKVTDFVMGTRKYFGILLYTSVYIYWIIIEKIGSIVILFSLILVFSNA